MLKRFFRYVDKIFGFPARVAGLRDGRIHARIPTANVFIAVFTMFVPRLRSFNALEQEPRRPWRWDKLIGGRKPSADTLGYALCEFEVGPLRDMIAHHHRTAWRTKAVHARPGERFRVVAIDGHERWWSTARECPQCLIRDVTVKVRGEQKVQRQYYHRFVVAQWVGVTPPGILDVERIRPGEGEPVAARRLLDRLLESYGRLIDVISADAIYLEAPFLRKVLDADKHFVVVMKQEARELYQDAASLRRAMEPQRIEEGRKTSRIWDLPELATFTTLGRPVRVVWAEERTTRNKIIGGEKQEVVEEKTWVWVTDLSPAQATATRIQRWGHDRWDVENRGFNELVQHWRMDHRFIHDPIAIEAILLTLALAFLTTYLFHERNLKPSFRRHLTRLALALRLAEDPPEVEFAPSG